MIPSFLLAKLYVKGSLKNTADGFEFSLKNIIDNTMLAGIGPIIVGEKSYEGAALIMTVGDKTWKGDEVSRTNPIPARMSNIIRVGVTAEKLAQGAQRVSVSATTTDIGRIKFDISDTVQE
jgi:hydroxymethylglutaryl-CoA reductase (NADPH)